LNSDLSPAKLIVENGSEMVHRKSLGLYLRGSIENIRRIEFEGGREREREEKKESSVNTVCEMLALMERGTPRCI
jgi:hypothetical protein